MRLLLPFIAFVALAVYPGETAADVLEPEFRFATRGENYFSISLFPPLQWVPEGEEVTGLRLNLLYGSNTHIEGFDLGLINEATERHAAGLALGVANLAGGTGGLALGVANVTREKMWGIQFGAYNRAQQTSGLQLGLVNSTGEAKLSLPTRGLQIGILNLAQELGVGGLQIGLLNVCRKGGILPWMPFVNWRR